MFRFIINTTILLAVISGGIVGCSDSSKTLSSTELLRDATAMGEKGNWREAIKLSRHAVRKNPKDANALVILALGLEQNGESASALDSLQLAVKMSPENFMAQFTLGRMLFQLGKYEECVAPLKNARDLDQDNVDTVILLAKTMEMLNLPECAEYYHILAMSKRFINKPEPFNELGVYYTKKNDYKRASSYFIKAYKMAPQNHIVVYNLAVFLDKYMNTPDKAKKFYLKYLELAAKNPELEELRNKVQQRISDGQAPPSQASKSATVSAPADTGASTKSPPAVKSSNKAGAATPSAAVDKQAVPSSPAATPAPSLPENTSSQALSDPNEGD